MNRTLASAACIVVCNVTALLGATTSPLLSRDSDAYRITERGPNHRVWKQSVTETLPDGKTVHRTNSFTELAAGLHYRKNGQWIESDERIEIVADGAQAVRGPHKVHFNGNANTRGAISVETPDGKVLSSHVTGLAYTDSSSGQSVLIASLKDSTGQLVEPNQVIYENAFDGVVADLRYTYTRGAFEQDVILREEPASPSAYGLNPDTTMLEVWTEFFEAPEPVKVAKPTNPGPADQSLSFGAMRMDRGAAFSMDVPQSRMNGVPVGKNWIKEATQQRRFLVESVRHKAVRGELSRLPKLSAVKQKDKASRMALLRSSSAPSTARPTAVQMAVNTKNLPSSKGLVLDYILTGGTNDFTFKADTTYLINGMVSLTGTTTFEGGAVIKYATTNESSHLQNFDAAVFNTEPYRPVIFTSQNDRSVGADLYAAGTPTNYFQALSNSGLTEEHKHFRISYADYGLHTYDLNVRDGQFTHCKTALYTEWGAANIDNVLMWDVGTAFSGTSYTTAARHVTVHECGSLTYDWGSPAYSSVAFTNSLLVQITNSGSVSFTTNCTATIATNAFQTVGGGAHYLPANSPLKNGGTTNVPGNLAKLIKKSTTEPPIVFSPDGIFLGQDLTLSPRAQRDTDVPDLGYHYAPLDYAVGPTLATNATIRITPGTAVAAINPSNASFYAFAIGSGGKLICDGKADAKVTIAHYNAVQEVANRAWAGQMYSLVLRWAPYTASPLISFNFTDLSVLGGDIPLFYTYSSDPQDFWSAKDTQFRGGNLMTWFGPGVLFTNCLFDRVAMEVFQDSGGTNRFHNCTWNRGSLLIAFGDNEISFSDSLFVGTHIEAYSDFTNLNVGYTVEADGRLSPTNSNDVVIANFKFESGPLGRFYVATNSTLINAGSRSAASAGLYHYTIATNLLKEASSTVDIGFHYVATDTEGRPLDSDGDGTADYLEDTNGNGTYDSAQGETDWSNYNSPNGLSSGPALQVFTPLK